MARSTRPHRHRRYLAQSVAQLTLAMDEASLPTVEMLDARERAAGGRWREARTLAPGEVTISDERLT